MSCCGTGHHSQNGIAEACIQLLLKDSRAMLVHGMDLWPEVVTKGPWLYTLNAACRSRNKFNLDSRGHSPEMKLAQLATKHVQNEHTMFCPFFILNKKLQGGPGMIPKWNPRADTGVYLGTSPVHSSEVALVFNLATGHVSQKYHMMFDDHFTSVDYIHLRREPSNREFLVKNYIEDYNKVPKNLAWLSGITKEITWINNLQQGCNNQTAADANDAPFIPDHDDNMEPQLTDTAPERERERERERGTREHKASNQ